MGRLVSARKRTLTALGVGVIASAAALRLMPWHMARSWGGVASVIYPAWGWTAVWRLDGEQTAAVSTREDVSRPAGRGHPDRR
jgi:hypothetical protein